MRLRIGGFRTPFRTARMCMCTASGAVAHDFTLSETRAIEIFRAYFQAKGPAAVEKFFWRNSIPAFRWIRRDPNQPQLG